MNPTQSPLSILSGAQATIQSIDVPGALSGSLASGRIVQLIAILSVLSIAPSLLVMTTSFTRIVVALSFLRSGLGLQSTPANLVMTSLALFMTYFVMAPTLERSWNEGVAPLMSNSLSEADAFPRIIEPFREFMTRNVRARDLKLLENAAGAGVAVASDGERTPFRILIPAFMMSELRRGFEIGFLIVLPFLVIDLVVATVTMSMGMMMLPPSVISLPVKVLFFVLIDGWSMIVGSLLRSYGTN